MQERLKCKPKALYSEGIIKLRPDATDRSENQGDMSKYWAMTLSELRINCFLNFYLTSYHFILLTYITPRNYAKD
jgi:hypothetical protein